MNLTDMKNQIFCKCIIAFRIKTKGRTRSPASVKITSFHFQLPLAASTAFLSKMT